MLYPKTIDMFHFGGDKQTNPNCPIELRPNLNPSSGIQSYDDSDPMCLKPAYYNFPFFLNKLGPRSSEWSINAHEARPGHHIQVMILVVCNKLSRTHKTDWFSLDSHGSSFNNHLPTVMFLYRDERRPLNFRLSRETLSSDRVHLVKNTKMDTTPPKINNNSDKN